MRFKLFPQHWLYYEEAQEAIAYTHKVTGDLDVDRLVGGQKPWRLPLSRQDRPKKLIIADWRIETYSEQAITKVVQRLEEASSAGFSLYIWKKGDVHPFSKDALDSGRSDISPALPGDIAKAAFNSQYGFTKENVCVLDDYWLGCFLNEKRPCYRSISFQVYLKLSRDNRKKLRQIIPDVVPPITHLVLDVYPHEWDKEEEFQHLKVITHYQFASFKSNSSILEVQTFLAAAPNLQDLNLCLCAGLADAIDFEMVSLMHLETLLLSESNISLTNLGVFLAKASNLNVLELGGCQNLEGVIDLREGSLRHLETLCLEGSSISLKSVGVFLAAAPNLKKLELNGCKNLAGVIDLREGSLRHLETLCLEGSSISLKSVGELLTAALKLKTLNLSDYEHLNGVIDLPVGSLRHLETLWLTGANVSLNSLGVFLTQALNLKTLDLSDCEHLAGVIDLPVDSLRHLETLTIKNSSLPLNNLGQLLKAALKLKTLDLSLCENSEDIIDLPVGSLRHLENLWLGECISLNNLGVFLTAALKLKILYINKCENLAGVVELKANSLKHLESLDLSGANISLDSLCVFLVEAPNLKALDISLCENLAGIVELKANSLKHLESLNLSGANISLDNVRVFLVEAPNLKELDISLCENLAGVVDLTTNSLKHLELLDISESALSLDSVRDFLEAAPNLKELNLVGTGFYKENITFIPPHIDVVWDYPLNTPLVNESPNPSANEEKDGGGLSLTDPVHHPAAEKDNKPTPEDFKFEYKGKNLTKNQGMVIEKLSQYLVLTKGSLEKVRSIQNGICYSLSCFFLNIGAPTFKSFLDDTKAWNGMLSTLTPQLRSHFDVLIPQLKPQNMTPKYYLGECLADFLKQQNGQYLLYNPWHAIALQHTERGVEIYDPNFVNGSQVITSEEKLLSTITNSLGFLVATEVAIIPPPVISSPYQFIAVGGLLALYRYANKEDLLACINIDALWSMASLEGLFFRTNEGVPAWAVCIGHGSVKLKQLTIRLLRQLKQAIPESFEAQLMRSLEAITPQEQQEHLTKLRECLAQGSDAKAIDVMESSLIAIEANICEEQEKSAFANVFTTWRVKTPEVASMHRYGFNCLTSQDRSLLIQTSSSLHTEGLRFGLENMAHDIGRPFFYIDTPDALVCAMPFIKNEGDKGVLQAGPGGALYEFLNAHEGQAITLCVNYDTFEADDMVRLNTLLDSKPSVDGIALPEACKVIGIMNTHRDNVYEDSDFYSRFMSIHTCPLSESVLQENIPPIPYLPASSMEASDTVVINLFEKMDWKSDVLGQWVLINNQLVYQKGWLESALKTGKPLEIKNAPLGHTDFELCWQEALLRGEFYHASHAIELTTPISMVLSHGYDWSDLQHYFTLKPRPNVVDDTFDPVVLNESTFNQFFPHYAYQHTENVFMPLPGQLERCSDSTLEVYVTQTLLAAQWARLLTTAKQHQVNLHVLLAQGVELPMELYEPMRVYLPRLEIVESKTQTTSLILSQDIDTTLAMYFREHEGLVMDVSECEPEDLLEKTVVQLICSEVPHFKFQHMTQALIKGLNDDKTVILKGFFSQTLMNALVPFLLKRYKEPKPRGRLVLITEQEDAFSALPYATHGVSPFMKRQLLSLDAWMEDALEPFLATESLSTLKARRDFLSKHPNVSSENFRIGLRHIDTKGPQQEELDLSQSADETCKEMARRRDVINEVLESKPFVFLAGLSGVGKSTFVKTELKTKEDRLYLEEAAILAWIADKNPEGRKLLFLDEANLSPTQWSMFDGLFQAPPGLLYQGTFYPLTPEHKVIFAGNPLNVGGGRTLASLFTRHGNTVLLEPLPLTVIFEKIIKPVFENSPYRDTLHDIVMPFLNVYRFLMQCSETELLITPRELQMMALLTLAHKHHSPEADIQHIARYYAHVLAACLVPHQHRQAFNAEFRGDDLALPIAGKPKEDFLITASRRPLYQLLTDVVVLRELRQTVLKNDAERYGGLGGMVIEGEPGIGKTEFVLHVLRQYDFEEEHDLEHPSTKEKPFYRIPVSLSTSQKKARLLKAFDEGALVIIDEINSSPMLEQLLNALRMGTTPEGSRPKKPGFMMIGTQNPPSFGGRIAPSAAVIHRNINVTLTLYPQDEMVEILTHKGHQKTTTINIAEAFLKQLKIGIDNKYSPLPTFRDVMKLSDSLIVAPISARRRHPHGLLDDKEGDEVERDLSREEKSTLLTPYEHGFFKEITQGPRALESMEIENESGEEEDVGNESKKSPWGSPLS